MHKFVCQAVTDACGLQPLGVHALDVWWVRLCHGVRRHPEHRHTGARMCSYLGTCSRCGAGSAGHTLHDKTLCIYSLILSVLYARCLPDWCGTGSTSGRQPSGREHTGQASGGGGGSTPGRHPGDEHTRAALRCIVPVAHQHTSTPTHQHANTACSVLTTLPVGWFPPRMYAVEAML